MHNLNAIDPKIAELLSAEKDRQSDQIELIASENFVSSAVLQAQGSILTNKYAEGYPQRRYYGGCAHVDAIEELAMQRACDLFDCCYANVQPHSGSQANQGVFLALLRPGDTILGMALAAGGHLTHGAKPNLSGKWFNSISYGVDSGSHRIDMEQVRELALRHRPKLIIAGGSAYPRQIDFAAFREISDEVGAWLLVDMAHFAGLVAAKLHPSPFPHAHVVTTTTHKTLRGPRGGMILSDDLALGKKMNSAIFPGLQGGPLMHAIAAKAVCFHEAQSSDFIVYGKRVLENAAILGQTLEQRGLSLVTGGTDTHLLLVDLSSGGLTGQQVEHALEEAGLTCNKNAIPNDPLPPKQASGIRLGTPAGTTRGFGLNEFAQIGVWISEVIDALAEGRCEKVVPHVRQQVSALCTKFPLYG